MDQTFTVVSAEHVARYLATSEFSEEEDRRRRPAHFASGLNRHFVRYLLCATNFVTG